MKVFKPEEALTGKIEVDLIKSLPNSYVEDKVVLGIDIYKYSQYPTIEQIYIPVVFELLYETAASNIIRYEDYFFTEYASTVGAFKKKFISTGDGGFQIFENVFQAILFAAYFQTSLKRYNTGGGKTELEKNLYKIVSSIELRYAVSKGNIYSYKSNFYGPAIINNARILSKDNLNRMLIDLNSVTWLNKNINSVENLLDVDKEALSKTNYFKSYDKSKSSRIFDNRGNILSVDLQKIGALKAKETALDVFNLQIQVKFDLKIAHQEYNIYVVTVGNLNTSGINE